jgi:hypothetical protein
MTRLRFSIRALFAVVVLAAMGAWLLTWFEPYRSRIIAMRLRDAGVLDVDFNHNLVGITRITVDEKTRLERVAAILRPPYRVYMVVESPRLPPRWTRQLQDIKSLYALRLAHPDVTDRDIAEFANVPQLKRIDLSLTQVSDKSVPVLKGMPALEWLHLTKTAVTKEGRRELAKAGVRTWREDSSDER